MTGWVLAVEGVGQTDWLWADAAAREEKAIPSAFRAFVKALGEVGADRVVRPYNGTSGTVSPAYHAHGIASCGEINLRVLAKKHPGMCEKAHSGGSLVPWYNEQY